MERYVTADLAHLDAGLGAVAGVEDPTDRVVAFLRFYEEGADELMAEQSGCLYATVLAERPFAGTEINRQVARAQQTWRRAFVDLLRPALAKAGPRLDLEVDALADHLFTTFEGAFTLCRTLQDPRAMRGQLKVFRQLVEAVLGVRASPGHR